MGWDSVPAKKGFTEGHCVTPLTLGHARKEEIKRRKEAETDTEYSGEIWDPGSELGLDVLFPYDLGDLEQE